MSDQRDRRHAAPADDASAAEIGTPVVAPGDPEPLRGPIDPEVSAAQEERLSSAWKVPRGWRYWSAVNNSEVGRWYTAAAFAFFLFGGILALLMRLQLALPGGGFLSADTYNQIFTLHGTVMMFLFAVPVFEAFSIFILPEMLGARDLPFPRLSAYGFWSYLLGGVFVCGSIFWGVAPAGGWFMYPPMTTEQQTGVGVDIWLLGLTFIEIASIAAAVELIVGILKCRPPGMRINLMPLYAWYLLVVAVMILFAFPPLIAGDLLLEAQRVLDWPFFDPGRGGDPLLWQHLFWVFGHPEVYIVFLPSVALVAMIVPTFARRAMVGYSWVVLSAVGTGFLSFGLWVHHMFTTGLPGISLGFFSAASQAVAIPTGIQLFCFIATLLAGRVVNSVPVLYALGGMATFILGGLTGVMVALAPFDFQAHDTYFVVGHLHYVMVGGVVFPILAGVHYFYPLMASRKLSERLGRISFWIMFIGFNATFLPMHFTGLRGMTRRVFTYPADLGFDTLNTISTVGAFMLAAGFVPLVWDILRPKKREAPSERNPWGAGTLEWTAEIPDRPWGIRSIPEIDGRYPLWEQPDFVRHVDEGRFYLPDAAELKRETLVTSALDAKPLQCLRVSGPTWMTFWAAMFSGGLFIFSTFHMWSLAVLSGVLAFATILRWIWSGTSLIPEAPDKDVGLGLRLPLYSSGPDSVGWWAMLITMLGDSTAFAGLVFGYFFYWTVHDTFPPAGAGGPGLMWPAIAALLAGLAWVLTATARRCNRRARSKPFFCATTAAAILGIAAGAALLMGPWLHGMEPTDHVYPAIVWVLAVWAALHLWIGVIMLGYCAARRAAGYLTPEWDIDITNVLLYWHFAALTAVTVAAVIGGFPEVA